MKIKSPCGLIYILFCLFYLINCNTNDDSAEKIYIMAIDAYADQKYDTALELVHKALKIDRRFYQASFLEGKILFFQEKEIDAEKIFSRLINKYPSFTDAKIWYIRCLILSEKNEQALTELEKELSFNASDWRIYNLYALLGQKTNNYEQRLAMNRKAEAVLTDSAKVYIDLAYTWSVLGMDSRAREYLKKAESITGTNISMLQLENAFKEFMQD